MTIVLINNNKEEYILIPNEAIRIRVIANSNSKEDINVKENLKDDINKEVDKVLKNVTSIDEARMVLNKSIPNITTTVKKNFSTNNYNKDFNINYGLNYFPKKEFKGIMYEEGFYESLVVTIGEGKGDNYWCVLYPPLCIIDTENIEEIEIRSYIKDILNKYL